MRSMSSLHRRLLFRVLAPAGILGLVRIFRLPSPLVDAAGRAPVLDLRLEFPPGHLLFTPFSVLADTLSCGGLRTSIAFLAWLLFGYWPLRLLLRSKAEENPSGRSGLKEARLYSFYIAGLCAFLVWAFLLPRPMARLCSASADDLIFDIHSHTSRSWDGRRSFTPAANIAWHEQAGFSAGFVTDHNRWDGSEQAQALSSAAGGYRSLFGGELSLHGAHVVVLGPRGPFDIRPYEQGEAGLFRLLKECGPVHGALCVLSLPEYRRNWWPRREELARAGAPGFEIVNATPKGMDFSVNDQREIAELCRRQGLPMLGATDNHGWTRAAAVWNVMPLPGHTRMEPKELEKAVLERLRVPGASGTRVIERFLPESEGRLSLFFYAPRALWTQLRSLTALQAVILLLWIWGAAFCGLILPSFFSKSP
ncbi:MAG: hypothetical protein WCU88_07995 [Elusimicrobiota bacterium]